MAEPRFEFSGEDYKFDNEELEIERAEATKIYFREVAPRLEEKLENANSGINEKYLRLYSAARDRGINVEDIFANIDIKRRHLREIMGYSTLKISGGNISIERANDARVGNAYKRCFERARLIEK
ncbi:MAG: hypothetical protein AABX77_03275 [Nanoarchaeota archaeon]